MWWCKTYSCFQQHIIVVCVALIASKLCVCILKDIAYRLFAFWWHLCLWSHDSARLSHNPDQLLTLKQTVHIDLHAITPLENLLSWVWYSRARKKTSKASFSIYAFKLSHSIEQLQAYVPCCDCSTSCCSNHASQSIADVQARHAASHCSAWVAYSPQCQDVGGPACLHGTTCEDAKNLSRRTMLSMTSLKIELPWHCYSHWMILQASCTCEWCTYKCCNNVYYCWSLMLLALSAVLHI